jgi:putative inorganic carbon (HCO3(-)) transporter
VHSDKLSGACGQFVEVGWLLIALALPLYFNVYSIRTFEPDKVALFRSLVAAMAGAWLIGRLAGRPAAPAARTRPGALLLLVLALAGTWLLATATSLSPRISLWGSYEWRQGSYTFLCYLALFGLAAARLRSPEQSARLLTAILFASLPVSLYGIAQVAGLDLVPWQAGPENRAVSTLGHPNFLGAYLVMVIPLTAVRLLAAKNVAGRLAYGGLLALQGLCLLLTFSRSGWLAALGGGLVLLFLLARIRGRLGLFWRAVAIVALLVAGVSVLAYVDPGGLVSASPFEPLHSVLRGKSAATRIRLLEWQAMPSLIAARPLLGYGPDTFPLAFSRVYPPELAVYGGPDATGDHAHNQILDLAVDAGLVGAALYLAVVAVAVIRGLAALRRTADANRQLLLVGLISAVVACLLQHQLSFVTVTPAAFLWLYLGWIETLARRTEPLPWSAIPVPAWRLAIGGPLAAIVVAGTLSLIVATNVCPVVADLYAAGGTAQAEDSQWDASIVAYERALRLAPHQDRYYALLANSYQAGGEEAAFGRAEAALLQAVRLSPYDLDYALDLTELYYHWGVSSDPARLELALAACQQAAELSPTDPRIYIGWGRVYQAQGRYEAAIERCNVALALDPLHVPAYTALGDLYRALGEADKAGQAYAEARQAADVVDRLISKR